MAVVAGEAHLVQHVMRRSIFKWPAIRPDTDSRRSGDSEAIAGLSVPEAEGCLIQPAEEASTIGREGDAILRAHARQKGWVGGIDRIS